MVPRAIFVRAGPVKCILSSLSSSLWSTVRVQNGNGLLAESCGRKYCRAAKFVSRYSTFSHFHCAKVIQGQVHFGCARSSSTTAQEGKQQKTTSADEIEDPAAPNETWTPDSIALYKKLVQETKTSGEDWKKLKTPPVGGEVRLFLRNVTEHGKLFEYALFLNEGGRQLKGVVQFGPYTQGPVGLVHGGAIASILDSAIGVCSIRSAGPCFTANLSINYKRSIPLGTTAYGESRIDRVEGRKVFGSGELKSPDGEITYAAATALFILVNKESVTNY